MSLIDLPDALQIIELYNYEMLFKVFWIFIILGFSALYLFVLYPKQKDTPFYSIGFLRMLLTPFCYINLLTTPLFIFAMSPSLDGFSFFLPYFIIYILMFTLYILFVMADFLRYGFTTIVQLGGIAINDPRAAKVTSKIRKMLKKYGDGF